MAFILMDVEKGAVKGVVNKLLNIQQITEIHMTTGEWDILAKIVVSEYEKFYEVIANEIQMLDGIKKTQTFMALKSYKI